MCLVLPLLLIKIAIITYSSSEATSLPTTQLESQAASEVTNYLTMRMPNPVDDILSFWCDRQNVYPLLSQLAALYMSVSASSVPVECMFSTTGLISNGKRSSIGSDKLNRVSIIHDNVKFLFN